MFADAVPFFFFRVVVGSTGSAYCCSLLFECYAARTPRLAGFYCTCSSSSGRGWERIGAQRSVGGDGGSIDRSSLSVAKDNSRKYPKGRPPSIGRLEVSTRTLFLGFARCGTCCPLFGGLHQSYQLSCGASAERVHAELPFLSQTANNVAGRLWLIKYCFHVHSLNGNVRYFSRSCQTTSSCKIAKAIQQNSLRPELEVDCRKSQTRQDKI